MHTAKLNLHLGINYIQCFFSVKLSTYADGEIVQRKMSHSLVKSKAFGKKWSRSLCV